MLLELVEEVVVGTVELLSVDVRGSLLENGVVVECGVEEDFDDVLGVGVELVLGVGVELVLGVGVELVLGVGVGVELELGVGVGVELELGVGVGVELVLGVGVGVELVLDVVGSASVVGSGSLVVSGSGILKDEVVVMVVVLFDNVSVVVMVVHDCGANSPFPSCRLTSCAAPVAAHWRRARAQYLECMVSGVYRAVVVKPQDLENSTTMEGDGAGEPLLKASLAMRRFGPHCGQLVNSAEPCNCFFACVAAASCHRRRASSEASTSRLAE